LFWQTRRIVVVDEGFFLLSSRFASFLLLGDDGTEGVQAAAVEQRRRRIQTDKTVERTEPVIMAIVIVAAVASRSELMVVNRTIGLRSRDGFELRLNS